jgi:hypothetical protein
MARLWCCRMAQAVVLPDGTGRDTAGWLRLWCCRMARNMVLTDGMAGMVVGMGMVGVAGGSELVGRKPCPDGITIAVCRWTQRTQASASTELSAELSTEIVL